MTGSPGFVEVNTSLYIALQLVDGDLVPSGVFPRAHGMGGFYVPIGIAGVWGGAGVAICTPEDPEPSLLLGVGFDIRKKKYRGFAFRVEFAPAPRSRNYLGISLGWWFAPWAKIDRRSNIRGSFTAEADSYSRRATSSGSCADTEARRARERIAERGAGEDYVCRRFQLDYCRRLTESADRC